MHHFLKYTFAFSLRRGRSPWQGHSRISPGEWTAFFMSMFLWLFQFAYVKKTEKAINSNQNNFHAQNYVYALPADKFMGTSGDQASDTE